MKAEAKNDNLDGEQIEISSLPLFPLDLWLYPGIPLRLQVFEPRYLDMMSNQLRHGEGFGIVPIRKGREVGKAPQIYPLGVEVNVLDWEQKSASVLGITVSGTRRFRVLESRADDNQLITAQVDYFENDSPQPIDEDYQGLADLLVQLKEHPSAIEMGLPNAVTDSELSYQMAWLLPLSPEEKTAAFQFRNPSDRLEFIAHKVSQLSQV